MKYLDGILIYIILIYNLETVANQFLTSSVNPCIYCNGTHIACNHTVKFNSRCYPNAQILPITQELKDFILDKHNQYRNVLAGGEIAGYDPAIRMASQYWNTELQYLSLLNVLQCTMAHDKCRRTPIYPYVGQNLGYLKWRGYNFTTEQVLERLFSYWFVEYQNATMANIRAYPTDSKYMIGHFTVLAQERANQVGCSIVTQKSDTNISELYVACDYSFTNVYTIAVYRSGPSASACKTGTHPKFPNLCSLTEQYDTSTYKY